MQATGKNILANTERTGRKWGRRREQVSRITYINQLRYIARLQHSIWQRVVDKNASGDAVAQCFMEWKKA